MKIIWSPFAIDRASEIAKYFSLDNPTAASKGVDDIFEKVLILNSAPKMGRTVPEIDRKEIREIIFGNYRIIYRIEEINIAILTIRHTKQILPVDELMA